MTKRLPRIIGTGWCAPKKIRYNDDPIFDWIYKHIPNASKMFDGYDERRVLSTDEGLIDVMVPAAEMALGHAGMSPDDIDILIGWGSISEYYQPNVLLEVHEKLGLRKDVWTIPVCDDYSNYNSAVMMAHGLVSSGFAKNILICIGGNWTRNVSYHTPQSISAADGAGAAVVAMSDDKSKWYVKDQYTVTNSSYYGSMYTNGIEIHPKPPLEGKYDTVYTPHFFQITEKGLEGFKAFGKVEALSAVTNLLEKNKLSAADVSFMPHQTSAVLIDYWVSQLNPRPAQVLSTIKMYANMTVAVHAFNMGWFEHHGKIEKDKLVTLALGPGMHATSMLFERG